MKNKKTKLTPEVMFKQLVKVQELTTNPKTPVRSYHLMSNHDLGTSGIISSPVLNVLRKNKILSGSKKTGYLWNPRIPVTYKLAQTVANEYEKYRDSGYTFEKNKITNSCQNHAVEQEKQETVKPEKRVYTKKVKTPPQVKEGWFKRVIKAIFNIK